MEAFFNHPAKEVRKGTLRLLLAIGIGHDEHSKAAIEKAVEMAQNHSLPDDIRADAIDFISLQNPSPYSSILMKLFVPTEQLSVQLAALRTLSAVPDTTLCGFLIGQWPTLTPELRDPAVRTFFSSEERIGRLLDAIAKGKISPSDLSWPRKVRLMAQSNEVLRDRARVLFTSNNLSEINKAYQEALHSNGDVIKGKAIFVQQCSLCHQIRGESGIKFGPDLGTIHNWSAEAIMASILAPGQSISSGYDLWAVELNNGETFQGVISSETPVAISFQNSGSSERTVKRGDLKSIKALGLSAMPAGLEKQITVKQMADLLAFLKENK